MIVDVMDKVIKDGVIIVEEFKFFNIELEVVEGMQIDWGYIFFYFIIDSDCQLVEFDNFLIFIIDKKISVIVELVFVLEVVVWVGCFLLIIVEDIEGEVFVILVVNKVWGVFNVVVIKVFVFGDWCKVVL